MNRKKIIGLVLGIAVAIGIACIPAPSGLEPETMRFLGIFVGFLIWMLMGVAAEHILVLAALAALIITGTSDFKTTFAPFGQTTVWLIVAGFGLAAALTKCGLLKRIAFFVLKFFPENYRGQILAMFTAGLAVSPLLPSVNAKAVLMAPLSASVSNALGFEKGSKGASGLFSATYISSNLFGNAFFTGSLLVFVILGFCSEAERGQWNFLSWLGATWVWLVLLAVLSFVAILILYKPGKELEMPKGFAKQCLKDLGPMTRNEKVTGFFLIIAIIAWMTEKVHGVDSAVVAVMALACICLFTDFNGTDFRTKIPWETVVLVGGLLSIANMVTVFGVDKWMSATLGPILTPLMSNVFLFIPLLCILVYLMRYLVISQMATGTICFAIFGTLAASMGMSGMVLGFAIFMSTQVWNLSFHNTAEIAAIAATGGTMVEHKDVVKSSYAFMAINLIAMTASIPLWMALGLI